MNRVIIINLNGNAYQLEESGYDALRVYLDHAARRLEGNPDKDEIIADIEQAIAEKFRAVLGANKTVVIAKEVTSVIAEMGPVQDTTSTNEGEFTGAAGARASGTAAASSGTRPADAESGPAGEAKRLYTIREGAMLLGVCNGLAAYLNLDAAIIRILFVILTFFWGAGTLLYILLAVIIPAANTPAERSAAYGAAATAQEFIRRAKEGYYEGMKTFHDKHARREWKRKFKHQMRGWRQTSFYQPRAETSYGWNPPWNASAAHHWSSGFGVALFGLINGLIALVAVWAIYSLVKTGAVFGVILPAEIPLWVGIVGLIVLWNIVAWPVKILQWGAWGGCGGGRSRVSGPFGAFGDFLVGLCFLALIIWLADRYVPGCHEALKQLPALLHRGVDSVQQWLERQ